MHNKARNRALYSIAWAFDPDKDAQWIHENRPAGMGAPMMLAMVVNGRPSDT